MLKPSLGFLWESLMGKENMLLAFERVQPSGVQVLTVWDRYPSWSFKWGFFLCVLLTVILLLWDVFVVTVPRDNCDKSIFMVSCCSIFGVIRQEFASRLWKCCWGEGEQMDSVYFKIQFNVHPVISSLWSQQTVAPSVRYAAQCSTAIPGSDLRQRPGTKAVLKHERIIMSIHLGEAASLVVSKSQQQDHPLQSRLLRVNLVRWVLCAI